MATIAKGSDAPPPAPAPVEKKRRRRKTTGRERVSTHESFLSYRRYRWLWVGLVVAIASLWFFPWGDRFWSHIGGTWYGYTLGTVGALLILWLTLLGLRKRAITPGSWNLRGWTSAHVYLGLALMFIGTLHTGFQFSWNVHTLAWALMMFVIISGFFGVIAYWWLPRSLSANRFDEDGAITEKSMIERLRSLDRQIHDAAQPLEPDAAALVFASLDQDPFFGGFINRLSGKYPGCKTRKASSELRRQRAFRPKLADDPLDKVDALLTSKEATMGRLRKHLRLKSWLQVWLFIHVPVTFALIAALSAHIVSVFFYW